MKEEARVEISLENRFKEASRKAKEVREHIRERNDTRELDTAEWLAYDMKYVEEYVKQLRKELEYYKKIIVEKEINENFQVLYKKTLEAVKTDYISKSKVKEKIEELDKRIKSNVTEDEYKNIRIYTCKDFNEFITSVLQELLREE